LDSMTFLDSLALDEFVLRGGFVSLQHLSPA